MLGHERLNEERALLGIEARRRSSRRRSRSACRRQLARVGVSRSSARASRRRSRSSRTAPAAAPVAQRADQVAEMQTARRPHAGDDAGFGRHGGQPGKQSGRYGGPTRYRRRTGKHQRVQQHETRAAASASKPRAMAQRQQSASDVAAVERRNRHHVEHGEQHVQIRIARLRIVASGRRDVRLAERLRRDRQQRAARSPRSTAMHEIAGRTGGGDRARSRARLTPQLAHVHRAPASPSR